MSYFPITEFTKCVGKYLNNEEINLGLSQFKYLYVFSIFDVKENLLSEYR
jgi:hypothetical protein